jgi:hypothetical protein
VIETQLDGWGQERITLIAIQDPAISDIMPNIIAHTWEDEDGSEGQGNANCNDNDVCRAAMSPHRKHDTEGIDDPKGSEKTAKANQTSKILAEKYGKRRAPRQWIVISEDRRKHRKSEEDNHEHGDTDSGEGEDKRSIGLKKAMLPDC